MPGYRIGGFVLTVGDVCALGSRLTPGLDLSAVTTIRDRGFATALGKVSKQVLLNNCELFMLDEPDTDGGQLLMVCTRIARCGTAKALTDPPPAVIPPFEEGKREARAKEHLRLNGIEGRPFETKYKYSMYNILF